MCSADLQTNRSRGQAAVPIPPDIDLLPLSRQRKAQLARGRLGLCYSCSSPLDHYAHYCDACHIRRSDSKAPAKKAQNAAFRQRLSALAVDSFLRIQPGEYRPAPSTIRRMLHELNYTVTFRHDGDQITLIRLQ